MQIASFLPHYQLVCISFDISSFSLISYLAIHMISQPHLILIAAQFDADVETMVDKRSKRFILSRL